jgi:hypothetical protein
VYYEVGEILKGSGNEMKKGIRSLYHGTLQRQLDEGFYRSNPTRQLPPNSFTNFGAIESNWWS